MLLNRRYKLKKAIKNAEDYMNEGHAYRRIGEMVTAIACYSNALKSDPNYIEAYRYRGICHF